MPIKFTRTKLLLLIASSALFSSCVMYLKLSEEPVNMERQCTFVSSRGIMQSCYTFPIYPVSSQSSVMLGELGPTIYIQGSAMRYFLDSVLPSIGHRFTLVTGDCDEDVPTKIMSRSQFRRFIRDPRLVHWFSQNLIIRHPKMSIIPIGLDYHTMSANAKPSWGASATPLEQEAELLRVKARAPPLERRAVLCYCNFKDVTGGPRVEAMQQIPAELMFYEPTQTTRVDTWRAQSLMAFVVSPPGNGRDCHRTWEALILGCIPIVKSSPIDDVYAGLPVLIVQEWHHVTQTLLADTVKAYANRTWQLERLTLSYWASVIKNATHE